MMSGINQYGLGRKTSAELSPGSRKNISSMSSIQPPKPRKTVFFGEDDDNETSMYFPQTSVFRPDKEMMASQSPSQLASFSSNLYGPTGDISSQLAVSSNIYGQSGLSNSGLGNFSLPQRAVAAPSQFPRSGTGHVTPTSMNPNFPISLQQPQQPSPNRGFISAIGQRGVISQNQNINKRPLSSGLASSSTLANMSAAFGFPQNRSDGIQTGLDLSEFPILGNRNSLPSNPLPPARNYVGMVSKPVQESTAEFQIQQEDFPALPGAQNPPTSSAADSARKTPPGSTYEQAVSKDKALGQQKTRGIQTHSDGRVSNIPPGMVTDQFGLVGLLTFIRAAENDPTLVALAPGIDLTTLGLNLNAPENLYSTFQSPWADSPCRPQDIDFHVPAEYLTNIFIREKLAPIKLNRYGEDLLFFLYYMNGGDVLQLAAATELYSREWRYHKDEHVWITRAPGVEPIVKTKAYERGTYYFFDAQNWRKVAKEFHLEYEKLEDRPTLPPTLHHNSQQTMAAH